MAMKSNCSYSVEEILSTRLRNLLTNQISTDESSTDDGADSIEIQ